MSHPAAGKQKFFQDPPKSQTKYCAATKVCEVYGSRCGHTDTAEKQRGWRMTPPTLEVLQIDPPKSPLWDIHEIREISVSPM